MKSAGESDVALPYNPRPVAINAEQIKKRELMRCRCSGNRPPMVATVSDTVGGLAGH
ncbi:hypothetical protein KCP73_24150 [Salmonella enterica subsp. enterica]|nr:hypothetical protein KCP73_24150 [Salmonella enterica subsp. enterica]